MPTYEFRCRACGKTFTETRAMSESGRPAICPDGHDDTARLLTVAGSIRSDREPPQPTGGCCGGGCCG